MSATHDHERDAMYARLLDPKSNWPEPPLTGEHMQQEMRRWLPSPPTSPSGGSKHKGKGRKGGQQHQAPMSHGGPGNTRDEVNAVNAEVGTFMNETLSPHGHAHTAAGASGYGDAGR